MLRCRGLPNEEEAMPTLRLGSSGDQVTELQNILDSAGYSVVVDGQFGRSTEDAVKRFQSDHSLEADGVVGSSTWEILQSLG